MKEILSRLRIAILVLCTLLPLATQAQQQRQAQGAPNAQGGNSSSTDEDDPCVDPDDHRYCWTQDPITGIRYMQVPDTSHINLANRQTMAGQSLGLLHTGNLFSPHRIMNLFDFRDAHDYLFVNAYSLFAYRPEDLLFYNTRIPFTNVAYTTSGSSVESNDRLRINFAGNINSKLGIGTFLDYVYARGEYISQSTKPLKWTSYIYYNDDNYKATLTYNLSKLANQENGGIQDPALVLTPDEFPNAFTDPRTMSVNLRDTWNDMDSYNLHFNHSYDLGMWNEVVNPEDSTDVWDEFTPVASIFHSIDLESYKHMFRMDRNAEQRDSMDFFPNKPYINKSETQDSSAYTSFTTYAGIRINEGFSRWSQFGLSAFVGFQHQSYTMMQDTLNYDFISRTHSSNNFFVGGQLSRHQSSFLNFDVTARFGLLGDKTGDVDVSGNLQTILPAGKNDSITVQASGYIRNHKLSYMYKHYFSNYFKWAENPNDKLKPEQRVHLEGKLRYSRTGTEVKVGLQHISNYVYFKAPEFVPVQSSNQIEILSAELSQKLHWKAIHFDNRLLIQKSTHSEEFSLPKLVWETDLSLRFVIAHTLTTQMGVTGYYMTKYNAPIYQPATQQFGVQDEVECGGYPLLNAYINCNLKRMKFYIMYSGVGTQTFSNNAFLMPWYPLQSPRLEYGVVVDLQN